MFKHYVLTLLSHLINSICFFSFSIFLKNKLNILHSISVLFDFSSEVIMVRLQVLYFWLKFSVFLNGDFKLEANVFVSLVCL